MPATTKDATLIRDLPVDHSAPSADALGDALADAVAHTPLAVDLDAAGPAGFSRVSTPGARFQTWPSAVADEAGGLWDRLARSDGSPTGGPAANTTARESDLAPSRIPDAPIPDDELFMPDDAPVRPAGGDVAWPGTLA